MNARGLIGGACAAAAALAPHSPPAPAAASAAAEDIRDIRGPSRPTAVALDVASAHRGRSARRLRSMAYGVGGEIAAARCPCCRTRSPCSGWKPCARSCNPRRRREFSMAASDIVRPISSRELQRDGHASHHGGVSARSARDFRRRTRTCIRRCWENFCMRCDFAKFAAQS